MQEGVTILDILVLVVLAAFIYTRFKSHDLPKDLKTKKNGNKPNRVVTFPKKETETQTKTARVRAVKNLEGLSDIDQIKASDSSFNEKEFIAGAKTAYEMYYESFNEVDEETLESLLVPKLFDQVMEKVETAESEGQKLIVDVAAVSDAQIVDAKMHGRTAVIDVKYVAEQAEYTEDSDGETIKGSVDSKKVSSVWRWVRPVDADDLNWDLESITPVS